MRIKSLIISLVLLSVVTLCQVAGAVTFRAIMIDTTTLSNANATGVSIFVIRDKIQVGVGTSAVTFFSTGFNPTNTAGQFLVMDNTGTAVTTVPITSAVTGAGGVNAGLLGAIAFYGTNPTGATIYPLDMLASSVLTADSATSPVFTQTLPNAVMQNITFLGTQSQGISGTTATFTKPISTAGLSGTTLTMTDAVNFESGVSASGASIFGVTEITGTGTSGVTAFNVKDSSGVSHFVVNDDGTIYTSGETVFLTSNSGFFTSGNSIYFFDGNGNSVDLGDLKN